MSEREERERERDIDTVNYDGVQHAMRATRYTLLALRQSLNIYYHSYAPVYDEKQACFRRDRSHRYFSKTHHCDIFSSLFHTLLSSSRLHFHARFIELWWSNRICRLAVSF